MIKTAKVISGKTADDAVGLFDNVLVHMMEDDEDQTIKIVTTVRTDPMKGLISKESPFGRLCWAERLGRA